MSASDRRAAPLPAEVLAVWLLVACVSVEILVTYWRVPARELYHVSGNGLVGGASRALVFLNFPAALVAIAIVGLLFERLRGRTLRATAVVAAVLCAAVFWPGVVSQANLDAKPVNALAAIGVLLTLVLTIAVARSGGVLGPRRRRGDIPRIVVAVVLLVVAAPWVAADLGFFLDGVPVLGGIFHTARPFPDLFPFPPTVHHGHHHGMDGYLLVLTALLLSRPLVQVLGRGLRSALTGYLALMLCYGLGNIANDLWIEQVWKRGWASWQIPNVLEPRPTVAWAVLVAAAAAIWVVARRTA
jgi:hypothetical protein